VLGINLTEVNSIYDLIGGEAELKILVKDFYRIMSDKADYKIIRDMHPEDITSSVEKLFMFLSGWFGGPNLYMEKIGHPRLRARHLPFSIGNQERDQWIACMRESFISTGLVNKFSNDNYEKMMLLFTNTASFMRNKDI
jgi:hemoglobin